MTLGTDQPVLTCAKVSEELGYNLKFYELDSDFKNDLFVYKMRIESEL